MGVVAPRDHGICTHWGTQEVSHNPTILSGGLLSFPMHPTCACHPCPSSHVLLLGFCVYLHMLINICVGASVATFHHGTHMQAHPGPVRIAQGVMLEITHSTMIKRGKLLGQHSRGCHCYCGVYQRQYVRMAYHGAATPLL